MPFPFFRVRTRPLPFIALILGMLTGVVDPKIVLAEEASGDAKPEFVYELDAYYSDIGYNIPLTNKPIPTISSGSEAVIYRELIKGSLIPQYMLLEASIYPMPILGTFIKSHSPGFYDQFSIGKDFNVIESLTAGFQEPWALSAFFGNVARLKRPGDHRQDYNYGYTGYLVSVGTKHIMHNTPVNDDWCELEWKIKGKIDHPDEKLSWSFRIGGKFNKNHDVNNVTFINLHRTNTDLRSSYLAWLENTNLDFRLHFLQHGGKLVRSELIAGKKIPLPDRGFHPTFSLGFIWTSPDEYSGALRFANANKLTLVIRPSIEF